MWSVTGKLTRTDGASELCAWAGNRLQVDSESVSCALMSAWQRFAVIESCAMRAAVSAGLKPFFGSRMYPSTLFRLAVPARSGSLKMRPATAGNSTFEFRRS